LSRIRIIIRMPEPDCFLPYRMHCNAEFYYVGKICNGHASQQRRVVLRRRNTVVGGKCALPIALLVKFWIQQIIDRILTSCSWWSLIYRYIWMHRHVTDERTVDEPSKTWPAIKATFCVGPWGWHLLVTYLYVRLWTCDGQSFRRFISAAEVCSKQVINATFTFHFH